MRVLFVATEVAPWVKVGGLGDVVGSLPRVLRELGVDARICIPAHGGALSRAPRPEKVASFAVGHRDGPMRAEVFASELSGVPIYLVSGPALPADGVVYPGRADEEGRRFTFFSLAAVELTKRLDWRPDVLHCHDWHTAVAVHTLAERRRTDPALAGVASLLTIHNLPYTGDGAQGELHAFGIVGRGDPRVAEDRREVPLTLGLLAADHLSTVSPGYAREMLGPEHGCGFEHLLRSRRAELTGVLNGLDVASWDPETDPHLAAPYSADAPGPRHACREALLEELELPGSSDVPLIGLVSRLVGQKGVDLALGALRQLADRPWHAVILGTGEPALERAVLELAVELPRRVRAQVAFDETLARRIYAGADLLLVPSRYEPCGMTQMIAMRYGCVPVARETGGLADTVRDLDLSDRPTGVLFPDASARSLAFAIRRASALYQRRARWAALVEAGMREDFSWQRSARAYLDLYRRLGTERKKAAE
jgi:starch synthase